MEEVAVLRRIVLALVMTVTLAGWLSAAARSQAPVEPRIALVVGNGAYSGALGRLANPVNDAIKVADALRSVGFNVELVVDVDQRTLKQAISRFGQRLDRAGRATTGIFYYAGHGVQSRGGTNYLIPVNATLSSEADLDLDAVDAGAVLAQMQTAGISTSIVILDACRNMPFARGDRAGTRGLARMDAPNGSYIAYSTAPGQTATDGTSDNSPFAAAFIREIRQPGQSIDTVFTKIRRSVSQATGGTQIPWSSSSLLDSFYFRAGSAAPVNAATQPPPVTIDGDALAWQGAVSANTANAYRDYLRSYSSGRFATLARENLLRFQPVVVLSDQVATADQIRAARLAAIAKVSTADPAEDLYLYGYRLWQGKFYPEAETQFKEVVANYPTHRRASWAQNLLGRVYMDQGKNSLASIAFYDNYKNFPKGERAADSLLNLATALHKIGKPSAQICKIYEEIDQVYGSYGSATFKEEVRKGRAIEKCL